MSDTSTSITEAVTEVITDSAVKVDAEALNELIYKLDVYADYITGFMLFGVVCLLCFGVYKFFRMFI